MPRSSLFPIPFSLLLAPFSLLWGVVAVLRGKFFDWGWLKSRSFPVPIICVGNLAVGGTGKTPHVEYILRLLHARGIRVAMLSRGYGRKTRGFVLAKAWHTAADIGDEPLQVRLNCPWAIVAVCERRVEGIRRLLALDVPPAVIVLDDAYQHRYVRAGLNVLLTEARLPYTRDHLIPWGRLREPASAARRADVVVVTKCADGARPVLKMLPHQRLFYSHIAYGQPYSLASGLPFTASLDGRGVLLLAGIAHPEPLRKYLESRGADEVFLIEFPDHHAYTADNISFINKVWEKKSTPHAVAFTTQKDAVRLLPLLGQLDPRLRRNLLVQPISVCVTAAGGAEETFNQIIESYVDRNQGNRRMD